MMGIRILVAALLCGGAGFVCAKQLNAPGAIIRAVQLDSCSFKMSDSYHALLSVDKESYVHTASYHATLNPKARHPFETWIQFSCQNPVSAKVLSDLAGFKMTAKGWRLDPSPESVGPKEAHTTFYPLRGKGWSGGGVTQDDTNGDEERRTRIYAFCIPRNRLALCGVVRPVGYLRNPSESVLPHVLKLLDSIEFVDTPTSTPASTSSAP